MLVQLVNKTNPQAFNKNILSNFANKFFVYIFSTVQNKTLYVFILKITPHIFKTSHIFKI